MTLKPIPRFSYTNIAYKDTPQNSVSRSVFKRKKLSLTDYFTGVASAFELSFLKVIFNPPGGSLTFQITDALSPETPLGNYPWICYTVTPYNTGAPSDDTMPNPPVLTSWTTFPPDFPPPFGGTSFVDGNVSKRDTVTIDGHECFKSDSFTTRSEDNYVSVLISYFYKNTQS